MYVIISAASFEMLVERFTSPRWLVAFLKDLIRRTAEYAGLPEPDAIIRLPNTIEPADHDVAIYLRRKGRPYFLDVLPQEQPELAIATLVLEALRDPRSSDPTIEALTKGLAGARAVDYIEQAVEIGDPLWILDTIHPRHLCAGKLVKIVDKALARGPLEDDTAELLASLSSSAAQRLAASSNPQMRSIAATYAAKLSRRAQTALARDPIASIRSMIASRQDSDRDILQLLATDRLWDVRQKALWNSTLRAPRDHEWKLQLVLNRRRLALAKALDADAVRIEDVFEPNIPYEDWTIDLVALSLSLLSATAQPAFIAHVRQHAEAWLRAARPFTNLTDLSAALEDLQPLDALSPDALLQGLCARGQECRRLLFPEHRALGLLKLFPRLEPLRRRETLFGYELDLARVTADLWLAAVALDLPLDDQARSIILRPVAEAPVLLRKRGRLVAILGLTRDGSIAWSVGRRGGPLPSEDVGILQRLIRLELAAEQRARET
jgi:hypothetical protein